MICDDIAEKLNQGENIWNPNLRQIIGWMLNQNWAYPMIYALDLDSDDEIVMLASPEDEGWAACHRDSLVIELLRIAEFYGLNERERSYLLGKVPRVGTRKSRKPDPPGLAIATKLRLTYPNGQTTFHPEEEQEELTEYCRRKKLTLHKNVRGEWRQIVP